VRLRRVLVLSAWEPEIAPLRRRLARAATPARAKAVVCRAVGVGLVDAGVNAARALGETEADAVVFVGTAGSYAGGARSGGLDIASVAVPRGLVLVSTAGLRGDGYTPEPMVLRAAAAPRLAAALARGATGTTTGDVATPLAITRSAALARTIARATGAATENLEAFAVARSAAAARTPFAAVLGVANRVGPRAHEEWRRHHAAASQAACDVVWTWLRGD
jgi:purine-nucleoside phosphorylase